MRWEIVELESGGLAVAEVGTGLAVCKVNQPRELSEPNARLIATSPVMLKLLERFDALDTDPHVTDAEWSQFRRDVHALLRIVEGQS